MHKILSLLLIAPTALFGASVTNTNDSGPGSFREAVADGEDITIDVSGTLNLQSDINLENQISITGTDQNFLIRGSTVNISDQTTFINQTVEATTNVSGTLIANVSSSSVLNWSGYIDGKGGLTKTGTGVLRLSGINEYARDTVIEEGTLVVAYENNLGSGNITFDGASLAPTESFTTNKVVVLTGNGKIDIPSGKTLTLNGSIEGSGGALVKANDGTLNLTGTNTYSSGTVIEGGTVSVSADYNLGSEFGVLTIEYGTLASTGSFETNRGAIMNGAGTIDIASAETVTLSGTVTGSGKLLKDGPGTLILSGNNNTNWSGGLTVNEGTVKLDSKYAAGTGKTTVNFPGRLVNYTDAVVNSLVGDGEVSIGDTNALTINVAEAVTSNITLTGSGNVHITGGNEYNFNGHWPHTGDLVIDGKGSALRNGGTISSNTIHVRNGAAFRGDIVISHVNVENGGVLSPGNSVGTVTITGDASFGEGGYLEVEFDGFGNTDLVNVSGNTSIHPQSTVVFAPTGVGSIKRGDTYTFLTSSGGIAGEFGRVHPNWLGDTDRHAYLVSYSPGAIHMTVGPRQAL